MTGAERTPMLTAANVLRIAAAVIDAAEWSLDEDGRRLLVGLLREAVRRG